MARPSLELVRALRRTARTLEDQQVTYLWSSFGHCNCGHLAQALTSLGAAELQRRGQNGEGDWGHKARIYAFRSHADSSPEYGPRPALDEGAYEPENVGACDVAAAPLDAIFSALTAAGLSDGDVENLERLSDTRVRRALGNSTEPFPHYERANVITYLRAWASLLEGDLPEPTPLAAE